MISYYLMMILTIVDYFIVDILSFLGQQLFQLLDKTLLYVSSFGTKSKFSMTNGKL